MPHSDPAQRRAVARGSMQRLRARRTAQRAMGLTVASPDCDVTSIRGCQALLIEAVQEARDPSLDAATRSRLLLGIAAAGSRIIADGALEQRIAAVEEALEDTGTAA